jgi:hypothetical protein
MMSDYLLRDGLHFLAVNLSCYKLNEDGMKTYQRAFVLLVISLLFLAACSSKPVLAPGSPLSLASFSENGVSVTIFLEQDASGQAILAATFSPLEAGYHLYSMNLPPEGVNGIGRPTLLELIPGSQIQAKGELTTDILEIILEGAEGLMVYPEGPVTLRMAILLPGGNEWVDENISVTYMACSSISCRPPVIDKLTAIRIPGSDMLPAP